MTNGTPIRPGCEMVNVTGDDHEDEFECFTCSEPWPCPRQQAYERKPRIQVQILREQLAELQARFTDEARRAAFRQRKLEDDNRRAHLLLYGGVLPFLRDHLRGGNGSLEVAFAVDGMDSVGGLDTSWDGVTYNNAPPGSRPYQIKYTASDGTEWINGQRSNSAVKPD